MLGAILFIFNLRKFIETGERLRTFGLRRLCVVKLLDSLHGHQLRSLLGRAELLKELLLCVLSGSANNFTYAISEHLH